MTLHEVKVPRIMIKGKGEFDIYLTCGTIPHGGKLSHRLTIRATPNGERLQIYKFFYNKPKGKQEEIQYDRPNNEFHLILRDASQLQKQCFPDHPIVFVPKDE